MKNKIIIFCIVIFFASCKSSYFLDVENISNISGPIDNYGVYYDLPKTEIVVSVKVRRIVKSKGPYEEYCQKYLGNLSNVIKKNETKWQISDVSFITIPQKDSHNIYYARSSRDFLPLSLTKEGFLLSYNDTLNQRVEDYDFIRKKIEQKNIGKRSFYILPADKSYKIVYDTIYKEEVYDTIIKKVPILKSNLVRKSTEEQAKELADKLLTLKDDRAALLVGEGDNDYLPTGPALRIMLDEIDKLEASYLKMFIGQIDTSYYVYYFSYEPQKDETDKKILLFKFSDNSGILPSDNIFGTPVYLEVKSEETTSKIGKFNELQEAYLDSKNKKMNRKGLFYRIPAKVRVILSKNNQILSEKSIFVAQLGEVSYLPADMFNYGNVRIDFYPELGSIKKIDYNRQ
jgi:hypothetical protein